MHRSKRVEKSLRTIMTGLLTIGMVAIAPEPDSTLSKPEKGDCGRLILCEGDRFKPLSAQGFEVACYPLNAYELDSSLYIKLLKNLKNWFIFHKSELAT